MHSFQPSRGRVLFEVLCALTISASCAVAWVQTGASALLGAAGAAALYGLVHLFDMRRPEPAEAVHPQNIEVEPEIPVKPMFEGPVIEVEPAPMVEASLEGPVAPRTGAGRRKGGSRKGSGRRSGPRKAAEVVPLPAVEELAAPEPVPFVPEPIEAAVEEDVAEPWSQEEVTHLPVAPLFEPEPFVRMPRQAFGRRGRL